jgi:hypothetical protein
MVNKVGLKDKLKKRYIDLQERGVISYPQLTGRVNGLQKGFDNPECSIDPSNR